MRRTRTNYAMLYILTSGMMTILGKILPPTESGVNAAILFLLVGCTVQIYLAIGRLKDMDKNLWWSVATLLPFVGFILMFPKGTQGANQYGEDPRKKGK